MPSVTVTYACGHTEEFNFDASDESEAILQELAGSDCVTCTTWGRMVRKAIIHVCGHIEEHELCPKLEAAMALRECSVCYARTLRAEHEAIYQAALADGWPELHGDEADIPRAGAIRAKRAQDLADQYYVASYIFMILTLDFSSRAQPEWKVALDALKDAARVLSEDFNVVSETLFDDYLRDEIATWLESIRDASVFIETRAMKLGDLIFHPEHGWLRTEEDISQMFESLRRIVARAARTE